MEQIKVDAESSIRTHKRGSNANGEQSADKLVMQLTGTFAGLDAANLIRSEKCSGSTEQVKRCTRARSCSYALLP